MLLILLQSGTERTAVWEEATAMDEAFTMERLTWVTEKALTERLIAFDVVTFSLSFEGVMATLRGVEEVLVSW